MAGRPGAKPYIFAPVRSLVQFVSSVVSLRGSMLFRSALWDVCLFVCLFLKEGGGMSVTSVQFPAQLRNIHNQKAIASTKQSYGAI